MGSADAVARAVRRLHCASCVSYARQQDIWFARDGAAMQAFVRARERAAKAAEAAAKKAGADVLRKL